MARHPVTRDLVWFNHAAFFHRSSLPSDMRKLIDSTCTDCGPPHATSYGDGREISEDAVSELWTAYREEERLFDWEAGDVLVIDNMLVAHGRRPYTGPREVLAALAAPCSWKDVAVSSLDV